MQKNIVFGVNAALAAETATKSKNSPQLPPPEGQIEELKGHIAELNSQFAAIVDEMRQQNEELRTKLDEILAQPKKVDRKKKTTKKTTK